MMTPLVVVMLFTKLPVEIAPKAVDGCLGHANQSTAAICCGTVKEMRGNEAKT